MYNVIWSFVGVIDGVEVAFTLGDVVSEDDAIEMNLANKPDIAEPAE